MKKKLLLKLARHLEDGKLGHKEFDFSQYNNSKNGCGTIGCAIGELPILFPKKWDFKGYEGEPMLKMSSLEDTKEDAMKFFDLGYDEVNHLFFPDRQDTTTYGGFELGDDATRYQVASNIRDFISMKERK